MGSPATPTDKQRAAIRQLAAAVIASVERDEAMPEAVRDATITVGDTEELVFKLCQEIAALAATAESLRRKLIHACSSGLETIEYVGAGDPLIRGVSVRLTNMRADAKKEQP